MGMFTNIKNWITVKVDGVTALDDMERVVLASKDLETKYADINDSYSMARGEAKYTEKQVANHRDGLNRILDAQKSVARDYKLAEANNNTKVMEAMKSNLSVLVANQESLQKTLDLHTESLAVQESVVSRLGAMRANTKAKLDELNQLKSQLQLKNDFTQSMKKYESYVDTDSGINIDEALRNIDVKFDAANFKFEDSMEGAQLDDILQEVSSKGSNLDSLIDTLTK